MHDKDVRLIHNDFHFYSIFENILQREFPKHPTQNALDVVDYFPCSSFDPVDMSMRPVPAKDCADECARVVLFLKGHTLLVALLKVKVL